MIKMSAYFLSQLLLLSTSLLAQNVGIGTTTPVNKLSVAGKMIKKVNRDKVFPNQYNADSSHKIKAQQKNLLAKQYAKKELTMLVTTQGKGQYGYYIFCDGNLMIDQKSIPAVAGNNGFKTIKEASIIAKLAIKKIKQGEELPTITIEELKTLKINF